MLSFTQPACAVGVETRVTGCGSADAGSKVVTLPLNEMLSTRASVSSGDALVDPRNTPYITTTAFGLFRAI